MLAGYAPVSKQLNQILERLLHSYFCVPVDYFPMHILQLFYDCAASNESLSNLSSGQVLSGQSHVDFEFIRPGQGWTTT